MKDTTNTLLFLCLFTIERKNQGQLILKIILKGLRGGAFSYSFHSIFVTISKNLGTYGTVGTVLRKGIREKCII